MRNKNCPDLGTRFGRYVVIGNAENSASGETRWLCRCDCGTVKIVQRGDLRNGHTRSCGCLRREIASVNSMTHGHSRSSEYAIWRGMFTRTTKTSSESFHNYGGRGIAVCDRWRKFENFLADMGSRPSRRHSIDRINNDGNYEPGNCRWATPSQQSRNARTPRTNRSGYRGVCWEKRCGKWMAQIRCNGKNFCLGYFDTPQRASEEYESARSRRDRDLCVGMPALTEKKAEAAR
jgi:hypothetical protein